MSESASSFIPALGLNMIQLSLATSTRWESEKESRRVKRYLVPCSCRCGPQGSSPALSSTPSPVWQQ
jgi:hypothetical protein